MSDSEDDVPRDNPFQKVNEVLDGSRPGPFNEQISRANTTLKRLLAQNQDALALRIAKNIYLAYTVRTTGTTRRASLFIDSLLRSFCRALKKTGDDPFHFMNDLLEFCLAQEMFEELEVLMQECYCPIRETGKTTKNIVFWIWYEIDTGAQAQIAKLKAPANNMYWEDSRFYTKIWKSVTLERVYPDDARPMSVTVHPDRIDYDDPADEAKLRDSEIWEVLERMRVAKDWEILTAWNRQYYDASKNWLETKALANTAGPHKFWIFPSDIVRRKSLQVHVAKASVSSIREDVYRFCHLMPERSEWLIVRKARNDSDIPNQPRPSSHISQTWYNALNSSDKGIKEALPSSPRYGYGIVERDSSGIDVNVPFIPYEYFEKTANYRAGQSYRHYMESLTDQLSNKWKGIENRVELCRALSEKERPKFSMKVDSVRLSTTQQDNRSGFFNEIPTGHAVTLPSNVVHGVNLVSTSWHDWKSFEIKRNVSRIVLPSGDSVVCFGTIAGDWIYEDDVEGFWSSINLIIVDCKFIDSQDRQVNFILSQSSVQADDVDILSSTEMRFLMAKLSPYLFRHAPPKMFRFGSKWKKFTTEDSSEPEDDRLEWEETNRRDKWDRAYDKRVRLCRRLPDSAAVLADLNLEYMVEQSRRRDWDTLAQTAKSLRSLDLTSSTSKSLSATGSTSSQTR